MLGCGGDYDRSHRRSWLSIATGRYGCELCIDKHQEKCRRRAPQSYDMLYGTCISVKKTTHKNNRETDEKQLMEVRLLYK